MRIYCPVHAFVPEHGSGAEWMLHDMLKYLVERGHEATVFSAGTQDKEFNGIKVVSNIIPQDLRTVSYTHLTLPTKLEV